MDTSNINNSNIFTEAFSAGIAKYNNPNLVSFNKSGTNPFGRVFNNELSAIKGSNTQRQNIRMHGRPAGYNNK